MSASRSIFATGRLIPVMIVAVGLADLVTRACPVDHIAFRAWEAMTYYRPAGTAFEPSAHYDRRSYGDLANRGNLPQFRVYRQERFTTDEYGFRNSPSLRSAGRIDALLSGDSFAAGSGVADEETLAAQLTQRGITTFSVAPMRATAEAVPFMVDTLGMKGGWLLSEEAVAGFRRAAPAATVEWMAPRARMPLTPADRLRRNFNETTWPLRFVAERWLKAWQDDRWFPNVYKSGVSVRPLVNGDAMLFMSGDERPERLPPAAIEAVNTVVARYLALQAALQPSGLRLAVVLVPDKLQVYAPLVRESAWPAAMSPYLQVLDRRLREAGVTVVNLYPALAEAARRRAPAHQYVYWPDDTHWNAAGIATAASEIANQLPAN